MSRRTFQFRLATLLITILVASIAFAVFSPKPKHHLHLLRSAEFDCADLARAVNYYVDLGEDETLREFASLADDDVGFNRGFCINERIGWLCRILFEPTSGSLRSPMFGALALPHNTMPSQNWPLYPVAKSGTTYCILSEGYSLNGMAEPVPDYLNYCNNNGVFRGAELKIPNRETAIRDLLAIRSSKRWTDIKWTDSGQGFSYTMNEPWCWQSVITQAESIP